MTDHFAGGPAWVGERGPDLLNLPNGSKIIPTKSAGPVYRHVLQFFRKMFEFYLDNVLIPLYDLIRK